MNSETESKIENIAKSIFLKNGDAQLKSEIDQLMLNAMKHGGMGFIKRKFTWWYLSSVIKRNLAKGKSLQDIESALRKITAKQIDRTCSKWSLARTELRLMHNQGSQCWHLEGLGYVIEDVLVKVHSQLATGLY